MKSILPKILLLLFFVGFFTSCGSATEVGNPTGEVPTRTVVGVIDTETITDTNLLKALSVTDQKTASVDPTELSVLAVASFMDFEEAPVDVDGSFEIEVQIKRPYRWEVLYHGETLGEFSFMQMQGGRGPQLNISEEGDPIDMGRVWYQEGKFFPEFDPMDY